MTGAIAKILLAGLGLVLGGALSVMAEIARPAEVPPASFAGQQYVDSKGCLFLRAGQPGNEIWLPRVTRKGVPLCGNAPSGIRVPVVEERGTAAVAPKAAPKASSASEAGASAVPVIGAGYFVAVGSFGVMANVDRAVVRLRSLNYPVAQGRIAGGNGAGLVTVYAGPFGTAEDAARARAELQGIGFPNAKVMALRP